MRPITTNSVNLEMTRRFERWLFAQKYSPPTLERYRRITSAEPQSLHLCKEQSFDVGRHRWARHQAVLAQREMEKGRFPLVLDSATSGWGFSR
jgi:hypothetical protein